MTRFSYQLYSSRNFGPLDKTLKMLANIGYAEVEGYGALYVGLDDVGALAGLLEETGLAMPTGHFGLDSLESDPGRALEIAQALGMKTVFCPYLAPDQRPTDAAGYVALGARLEAAGAPLREVGLGFGWHNHDFEFVALPDGSTPIARIFEGGPGLRWEADIAWIVRGAADPLAWIEAEGARISAVHLKDIAAAGTCADEDGWADVGHGVMDWPGLMAALRNTPAEHWIMEHDNPSDDARFARNALAAAKGF